MDEIVRGEIQGAGAMLTGQTRAASVREARDTELARLPREHFDALVHDHPRVLERITRILIHRLRARGRRVGSDVFSTLAVVPAGADAGIGDFVPAFLEVLAREGSVLHLDRAAFDGALGKGAADDDVDVWDHVDARTADWLTDQEQAHRFIVFEAEAEDTAWTRRCLRQADRALLVGRAGAATTLTPAEAVLFDREGFAFHTPADLVLLHDDVAQPPRGTAAWLAERPVDRHHHVHPGTRAHVERVVRFLTNRAVGVVLGGGGAKGAAHLGVLRALREAGIPVDAIGGTSSGAGIAAQYARGDTLPEIRDTNQRLFERDKPFRKLTLPIVAFVREKTLDETAQAMCGDRRIQDLWIPYFCVSCNLSTGETVVHRSGPLWKAVRATSSLPGIFPPFVENQHLLVDGGIVDNVPVSIMKGLNPGPAIVVNVSADVDLVLPDEWTRFPSPWRRLRNRLLPFARRTRLPTIGTILARVVLINSVARKKQTRALADFYLDLPVARFGILDTGAMDAMIDIGHAYAAAEIRRWRGIPEAVAVLPALDPGGAASPYLRGAGSSRRMGVGGPSSQRVPPSSAT